MARDVIITPASGLIDFQGSVGVSSATIELDSSGNLNIANPGGDLTLGDTSRDVYIGNGVANVDIIFEQDGEIRGLTGKTLTFGQSDSYISFAGDITSGLNVSGIVTALSFSGMLPVLLMLLMMVLLLMLQQQEYPQMYLVELLLLLS